MKAKKILKIFGIVILVLALLYLISPSYLQKALIYTTADIDDYKIFPNRTVEAGQHDPWKKSENYNQKEISKQNFEVLEKFETVAFLVIQDSCIVHEKYWDDYGPNSLSNSFSMAKSIIGLLVGAAMDDGYIDSLDQKVGDFLPEFAEKPNSQLTIKHLLTMSSGLNWDEHYSHPFSLTTMAYYGQDIEELTLRLQVVEEPGVNYKYLSGATQVLAFVLKEATDKPIAGYASEKLWKPLGAKNDALWSLDHKDGMEKAYCCFNSNARDFAKIGQLILNLGSTADTQIISKEYIKEMITPAGHLQDKNGNSVDFYGYHWWILHYKGYTMPFARGLKGQYIIAVPKKDAVIVRLGHKRSKIRVDDFPADLFTIVEAGLEVMN